MATITVEVTPEQWNRWRAVAGTKSDVGDFLVKAGDFYLARLEARLELAQRLQRDGRL